MSKSLGWAGALCLVLTLGAGPLLSGNGPGGADVPVDDAVAVAISPGTLNLGSSGEWVTAHVDIPFAAVAAGSVDLGGVPAALLKADDCGNLVAKFAIEDVKAIVAPPSATLTLTGTTKDGDVFSGSDTIQVVDAGGSGK